MCSGRYPRRLRAPPGSATGSSCARPARACGQTRRSRHPADRGAQAARTGSGPGETLSRRSRASAAAGGGPRGGGRARAALQAASPLSRPPPVWNGTPGRASGSRALSPRPGLSVSTLGAHPRALRSDRPPDLQKGLEVP